MNMAKIEDDAERWSVDDVLLVVSTYGPWGADLNGVHRQEIILADEVMRLRVELADSALRSADHLRSAIKAEAEVARLRAALSEVFEVVSLPREPNWAYRNTITTNKDRIKAACRAGLGLD